jgi:hypothetical protein
LVRRHAEVIVDDDIIFPVFRKFCKVYAGRHLVGPISYYFDSNKAAPYCLLLQSNYNLVMNFSDTVQYLLYDENNAISS